MQGGPISFVRDVLPQVEHLVQTLERERREARCSAELSIVLADAAHRIGMAVPHLRAALRVTGEVENSRGTTA